MIQKLAAALVLLALVASPALAQVCANPTVLRLSLQPRNCSGGTRAGEYCFADADCHGGGTCVAVGSPATCIDGPNNGLACGEAFDCPGGRCGQYVSFAQADAMAQNAANLCTAADTHIVSSDLDSLAELNTQITATLADGPHVAEGIQYGAAFPVSPATGDVFAVTDDSSVGACDSAAGSALSLCRWSGVAWVALGDGGGGIGGSTGLVDNAALRADGPGGSTAQGSVLKISDAGILSDSGGELGFDQDDDGDEDIRFSVTCSASTGVLCIREAGTGQFHLYTDNTLRLFTAVSPGRAIFTDTIQIGAGQSFEWSADSDTRVSNPSADCLRLTAGGQTAIDACEVAGVARATVADLFSITPKATAPATCTAATDVYSDTSGALCWCSSTDTWERLNTVGSCV